MIGMQHDFEFLSSWLVFVLCVGLACFWWAFHFVINLVNESRSMYLSNEKNLKEKSKTNERNDEHSGNEYWSLRKPKDGERKIVICVQRKGETRGRRFGHEDILGRILFHGTDVDISGVWNILNAKQSTICQTGIKISEPTNFRSGYFHGKNLLWSPERKVLALSPSSNISLAKLTSLWLCMVWSTGGGEERCVRKEDRGKDES